LCAGHPVNQVPDCIKLNFSSAITSHESHQGNFPNFFQAGIALDRVVCNLEAHPTPRFVSESAYVKCVIAESKGQKPCRHADDAEHAAMVAEAER
jgi:hypothetical protein